MKSRFESGTDTKIPDGMSLEQVAPLLCSGVTVYSPLSHFGLTKSGLRGGILGLGGVGKAMGHHVTGMISSSDEEGRGHDHLGTDDYLVISDQACLQEAADSLDYIIDTLPACQKFNPRS